MEEALAAFARRKDCPWDWEMGEYSKTKRSQGPDRDGLVRYAGLLKVVIQFDPYCFPSHVLLREVWSNLDAAWSIKCPLLKASGKSTFDWSIECADVVRRACKHVVEIKRSKTTFLPAALKELVDLAKDQLSEQPVSVAPAPRSAVLAPPPQPIVAPPAVLAPPPAPVVPRRVLRPQASDASSVAMVCAAYCRCVLCKPDPDLVVVSDVDMSQDLPSPPHSDTSLAAAENDVDMSQDDLPPSQHSETSLAAAANEDWFGLAMKMFWFGCCVVVAAARCFLPRTSLRGLIIISITDNPAPSLFGREMSA